MNNLLFDQAPLVVSAPLAVKLGLNEAIILQQLHYWISKNINIIDGKSWAYNTIKQWQEQFPFWSEKTLRRTLEKLIADGIIITGNYNKRTFDRTLWYSIDYDALDVCARTGKCIWSECPQHMDKMTTSHLDKMTTPIPEITPENTTEITINKNKHFTKPSIAEISDYCVERRNKIDPQAFYDYYESKGWKIGNSPMKDWQAAVRTWERRNNPQTPGVLDPLMRAAERFLEE